MPRDKADDKWASRAERAGIIWPICSVLQVSSGQVLKKDNAEIYIGSGVKSPSILYVGGLGFLFVCCCPATLFNFYWVCSFCVIFLVLCFWLREKSKLASSCSLFSIMLYNSQRYFIAISQSLKFTPYPTCLVVGFWSFAILLLLLFKDFLCLSERQRQRKRSSIRWFAAQMAASEGAGDQVEVRSLGR